MTSVGGEVALVAVLGLIVVVPLLALWRIRATRRSFGTAEQLATLRVLEEAMREDRTIAFFESPMRITKTLRLAAPVLGERPIVVARELTKLHETLHRGTAATLVEEFSARPPRGECTVVVGARP